MGAGRGAGGVGAGGAGGGAVRRGVGCAVSGVGAGDVAHGALIGGFFLCFRAPSGCCGVDSDSLAGMACMGTGF